MHGLTQWSKGEYQYATNQEDDLLIIADKLGEGPATIPPLLINREA
jgi:hypothetical protein